MITVNGRPRSDSPTALADLLALEGIDIGTKGIAIAVNEMVVPRGQWRDMALAAGDRVEIVKVLQGG